LRLPALDLGDGDLRAPDVDSDHGGLALGGWHVRILCDRAAECKEIRGGDRVDCPAVDRRLAQKNLRTALIAGAVCFFVFAAAWVAALVY
jgi:hypothetical protein